MSNPALSLPTHLSGRALQAGRFAYGLLLIFCLIVFGASLRAIFVQGISDCDTLHEWLTCADWFRALEAMRLTPHLFQSYFLALRLVAALAMLALSFLLLWRAGTALHALLLASLLVVLAVAGPWFNPLWLWGAYWFKTQTSLSYLAHVDQMLSFVLYGGLVLFAFLFPDGRFVPHWSRWLTAVFIVLLASYVFLPDTAFSWTTWPYHTGQLVVGAMIGGVLATVAWRYRTDATAVQRQQIKWVGIGFLLMVGNFVLDYAVWELYPELTGNELITPGRRAVLWELGQDTVWYLSQILFTICIGLSAFRRRLWGIDPILDRTIMYGGLTLLVVCLYAAIVFGLGALFQIQTSPVMGLLATVTIAVLFQPLRNRLQHAVNSLLYGERDDPAAALTQLAQQLETAAAPAILPNLVQTIARALKIPYVAIYLPGSGRDFEPAAVCGSARAQVETLPLSYGQTLIGQLVVAPRDEGGTFNRRERQLLQTIATFAASTVRAIQLSDELRRSRQRIVTAREAERRRLRRDLHDGLGPRLASQSLALEAIDRLMETQPDKARAVLESLKTQAEEATQDIRLLLHALRPPALDDLGLVAALQQSAARLATPRLQFAFDVPDPLPELPAAVETAAYRIVQEAMTNALRHAEATRCTIRLWLDDGALLVTITDNGKGLLPDVRPGVGLHSMRERAEELNGRCMIQSLATGGTQVKARLPLEAGDG